MDFEVIDKNEMGEGAEKGFSADYELLSDKDLTKAKKIVKKSSPYFIKAAREGSEWEYVNYAYMPYFKCQWCGHEPCAHGYFIEHREKGTRKVVGSICIKKILDLGGAYRKFEDFQKKIDKLVQLKEWKKSELVEKMMRASGEKRKVMLDLQEIEERIEKAKEEKRGGEL